MPTLGVDTLPSQRVPQKILKKSISLYYMLSFAYPGGAWVCILLEKGAIEIKQTVLNMCFTTIP